LLFTLVAFTTHTFYARSATSLDHAGNLKKTGREQRRRRYYCNPSKRIRL
jgi:hypothetical protein